MKILTKSSNKIYEDIEPEVRLFCVGKADGLGVFGNVGVPEGRLIVLSEEDAAQTYSQVSNEPSSKIVSNKATLFGEYLCINSMHTNLIFYEKDNTGNYGSWKFPEEILSGVTRTYRHFKYKDQLICVSQTEDGNSEIIIYNSTLGIENRRKITFFNPKYLCGSILYGIINYAEYTKHKYKITIQFQKT